MRSFGLTLKEERERHRLSVSQLAGETKIKKSYLLAMEGNNWQALPEYPIVVGFVRLIASQLGVKQNNLVALLRRDYPPSNMLEKTTPPREVFYKGITPRLWGLVLGAIFLLLGTGYLLFQYANYNRNPKLVVVTPGENISASLGTKIEIQGRTDPDASVFFNNQALYIDQEGVFKTQYTVSESTVLIFSAVSRAGKKTEITRQVTVGKK